MRYNNKKRYNYLKGLIVFEIKSWIGRKFMKSKSKIPLSNNLVLLDIGAGTNYTNNWIHVDFFQISNPIKNLLKGGKKIKGPDVQLDLRYPLNCPDNTIDGVYSSHTIEHLFLDDAIHLLKEIYRILKPSKWLRIIVPDLAVAVNFYVCKNSDLDFSTGCEAISSITQNWGHKSVWDEEFLLKVLTEIGFTKIRKVEYCTGGVDKRLIKETKSRKYESLVIEAQKPI